MASTEGDLLDLAPEEGKADPPPPEEGKSAAAEEDEEPAAPRFDWMPEGCTAMADGEYDVVVMGTGFTECLLSGLLCVTGMKVLVVDRNNYYGGESASLNLTNLFKKFHDNAAPPPEFFAQVGGAAGPAKDRDFNVDLIPKFIMAHGNLVKILLHTKVTRYLEFKAIGGSYVYKNGRVHKVPCSTKEALASGLMTLWEKRRFRNFLLYMDAYDANDPSTHKGRDCQTMTAQELYNDIGLDTYTQEFIGHAMGLFLDDEYLNEPAVQLLERVKLYSDSLTHYEDAPSPYLYPSYGLGGLPESFSRLAAINGGVFMLNRGVDEVLFNEEGQAWGIRGGNEVAKANLAVIGDPSYFPPEKIRPTGKVVRSICLLDHPVPTLESNGSAQIIIPGSQVNRNHDIYVCLLSAQLDVVSPNIFLVIVSTQVEGHENPLAELEPGIALLGPIMQRFDAVTDCYEPIDDGLTDRCFISKSYDDTSHFKTAADDVLDMYHRITGEELDMTIPAHIPQPGDY